MALSYKKNGFTLVELSIILVIVGLLTAGVLVGKTLVAEANLRAVISQVEQYKYAITTFKSSYNQLPGDMDNASSYWPSCADNGVNKCDGNNNGKIGSDDVSGRREFSRFWQHLALAELVTENFDDVQASTAPYAVVNSTVPGSKFPNGAYSFTYIESTGNLSMYSLAGNAIRLGKIHSTATFIPVGLLLTNKEAFSIDSKIDDGLPDSGEVRANNGHNGTKYETNQCVTGKAQQTSASFNFSYTEPSCQIAFFYDHNS